MSRKASLSRREMLQAAALLGTISQEGLRAATTSSLSTDGMIAVAGLIDDTTRLAPLDPMIPSEFVTSLSRNGEVSRLGAGLPESPKPEAEAPLAVWLGSRIARLAPTEWGIAEDAAILRLHGPRGAVAEKEFERYLTALDFRCRIAFHTLDPENDDIHAWLEGIIRWNRMMKQYKANLAAALASGSASDFANPADPVLRLALAARLGKPVHADDLRATKPSSPYGRVVMSALTSLRTA